MSDKTLDKKIIEAYKVVRKRDKIKSHLKGLESKIKAKKKDQVQLLKILDREYQDIDRLDKISVQSLFAKILGKLEDQLEIERQEFLHAYLQYDSSLKTMQALLYEKQVLEDLLAKSPSKHAELKTLLQQKKNALKIQRGKHYHEIMLAENSILKHRQRITELQEAIRAANNCSVALYKILGKLKNVTSWGLIEYYGKGSLSSYKKKMFIRNAKKQIVDIKKLLDKLETELRDVERNQTLHYRPFIYAFTDFVNDFYDALITDWIIQKKLHNSLHTLQNVADKVERITAILKHEIVQTEELIKTEEKTLEELLIHSAIR